MSFVGELSGYGQQLVEASEDPLFLDLFYRGITIVQLKLIEDIVDMILDGRQFDMEPSRNFFIAQTGIDEAHDLRFASGETGSFSGTTVFNPSSQRRDTVKSQTCDPWRAQSFSIHDRVDVLHQIG